MQERTPPVPPPPDQLSLLAGGQEHTLGDWEHAAAGVLRKVGRLSASDPDEGVWSELTRTTLDGFGVLPLGTADTAGAMPEAGLPGQAPFTRGSAAIRVDTGWDVRAAFADPDPARTADAVLADLKNGVTSLWLTLGPGGIDLSDLATVLDGVHLDLAAVVLDAPADPVAAAEAYAALLAAKDVSAAPGTNLGGDPIGVGLRYDGRAADAGEARALVSELARRARQASTRALVVDGTVVHDLGASDAQELAYTLATGAAYLRMLTADGLDVGGALGLLEFRYAATDEQFVTIAKLRAARRLWHRVAELSDAARGSCGQLQHAVTSRPMMSKYDPWVNMLRTTVAAFAAGVGGAGAVTVLPFDTALGLPEAFSRRIARNTCSLLIAEAHVAAVSDPAGGSYAIERLTDDLARAAWAELGRIEDSGGVLAAIADGSLTTRVERTAAQRTAEVARRERPLTGTTEFPDLYETLPDRRPLPEGTVGVARYAAPFESMRDDPAAEPVFVATMGPVAAHTARARFASNLLAAGGVDTVTAGATADVEAVLAAYAGAPVVCLAGDDKAYATWGADLVDALRSAGARWVVLCGTPTDALAVDDVAAEGIDTVEFLRRTRDQLEADRKHDGVDA